MMFIILLFCYLELIISTRFHIISKLIHEFNFSIFLHANILILWMLSFIIIVKEYGSYLINFKLIRRLLPFSTSYGKTLFWFNFLYIDNQHLFPQCHAAILFLHLVVRWNDQVIFHIKLVLNLTAVLIFVLYFICRLIYSILYHLERSWVDLTCPVFFLEIIYSTHQYMGVPKQFFLDKESLKYC